MLEGGGVGRHADLAAAEFARDVHHPRQVGEGMHAAGHQQRLVRHEQAAGALLGHGDRRGQMRVDALAPDGEFGQLLLHRLLLVEAGLAHVEQRGADHQVGHGERALHEGEGRVAVQRRADEGGRPRVPVEQHVLPGDQHVVEDDQRVDLVELVGQRIVLGRRAAGETGAADVLQARRDS